MQNVRRGLLHLERRLLAGAATVAYGSLRCAGSDFERHLDVDLAPARVGIGALALFTLTLAPASVELAETR